MSATGDGAGAGSMLAVLTPRWGAQSETFVRRHLTSLLPGRTVAITRRIADADWCPEIPMLNVGAIPESAVDRLARVLGSWNLDRRSCALRDFLRDRGVTVVLGQWLNFSAKWYSTLCDLPVRLFAHAHGYDVTRRALRGPWNRVIYSRLADADGVITFADQSRARLLSALPLRAERVHVIPYGVEIPSDIPAHPAREIVQCVHVGRFVEKKAPLQTLKAFERASRQIPALRLEMIGTGPLLPICERFVRERELSNVVVLHGAKTPGFVMERLAAADVFLLHCITASNGDEEGLPVAILEAMAHALPVISTDHSGIPEAVRHGTTGLLCAEQDETTMAAHICDLARQPAVRRALGIAGRRVAEQRFSAERELRDLRRVLFAG